MLPSRGATFRMLLGASDAPACDNVGQQQLSASETPRSFTTKGYLLQERQFYGNTSCEWQVTAATENRKVQLRIVDLDLERGSLVVYDPSNEMFANQFERDAMFVSSSHTITVQYNTTSTQEGGFRIEYYEVRG